MSRKSITDGFLTSLAGKSLSDNQAKHEMNKFLAKKYQFSMEHGPDRKQLKELMDPYFERYAEIRRTQFPKKKSLKKVKGGPRKPYTKSKSKAPCWYNQDTMRCFSGDSPLATKITKTDPRKARIWLEDGAICVRNPVSYRCNLQKGQFRGAKKSA